MHYVLIKDFLDADMLALAQQAAIDNEQTFVPTTVSTGVTDYRKSVVLWHYHFIPLYERFITHIRERLPQVNQQLGLDFAVSDIELQLTASNDGEYFKRHTDCGSPDTANRKITFVYYFLLSESRNFEGGDLSLMLPDGEVRIAPEHNSIIFFESHVWHEVHPVHVPSKKFVDSRVTLNGWVR